MRWRKDEIEAKAQEMVRELKLPYPKVPQPFPAEYFPPKESDPLPRPSWSMHRGYGSHLPGYVVEGPTKAPRSPIAAMRLEVELEAARAFGQLRCDRLRVYESPERFVMVIEAEWVGVGTACVELSQQLLQQCQSWPTVVDVTCKELNYTLDEMWEAPW